MNGDVLNLAYLDGMGTFFLFLDNIIMKKSKNLNELLSDIKVQMRTNNSWAHRAQGNILFCNACSALSGVGLKSKDIQKKSITHEKCSTLKRYLDSLRKAV